MKRKRNRFLTFLCSLIPGAGEMYMGFMKMGLSLLIMFMGTFMLATFAELSELIFVMIIIWIYSFFHVHNLAGMPDSAFMELEDHYIPALHDGPHLSRNIQKLAAALLIFFGIILLIKSFIWMMPDFLWDYLSPILHYLPKMAVAVMLILIGIKLIQGKKEALEETNPHTIDPSIELSQAKQTGNQIHDTGKETAETQAASVPVPAPELPTSDNNPESPL